MKVVVTGSLGHIGKPLTTVLVKNGHTVIVVSSKSEKQKEIVAFGAIPAIGSLEDVEFLISTFTGADSVFTMVPPNFAEQDQVAYYRRIAGNYSRAIQEAGVKRLVNLSSYGAHLDRNSGYILGAHHSEEILNQLQIDITHLRAGYFYYNLFGFMEMIKHRGVIASNFGGDDKIAMVHPDDIANAAAEELLKDPGIKHTRYVVSDEHSATETARILGTAIGKPDLQWQLLSNEQMLEALVKNGLPEHTAANFVELGAGLHNGKLLEDYELHKPEKMGKIKLEDFAKEFANAF